LDPQLEFQKKLRSILDKMQYNLLTKRKQSNINLKMQDTT